MVFFRLAAILGTFICAACAGAAFTAVNLPVSFGRDQLVADIPYAPHESGQLNIYRPEHARAGAKLPVVIFFYGGRWTSGDKDDYAFVAGKLVDRGYIVVIPDYRKYPAVRFPVFVEDAAAAVGWTHRHIASYGGDGNRLYLLGHSAGAHIASLLAANETYLDANDVPRAAIRAFAGLAGPYDFTPDEPDLVDMFGPPENYDRMRTTSFIDGHEPPMLLLHGSDDTTVERYNLERLRSKILAKRGAVDSRFYPGLDHVGIVSEFSWLGGKSSAVVSDVDRFFKAHP